MKLRLFVSLFSLTIGINILEANPVDSSLAKTIAKNFYNRNSKIQAQNFRLAFNEKAPNGTSVYYVFNINQNDGFVIVSGDDASLPILGYSTTGHYTTGNLPPQFMHWMDGYKHQILNIKANKIQSTTKINESWQQYKNNQANRSQSISTQSIGPLLSSSWAQSPNYNALCPNGSPTGCVATAMAQIMKYWRWPEHGYGTTPSYTTTMGTVIPSENLETTHYDWASMPSTSSNGEVAILMKHCGISVKMDYAPNGSGACSMDCPISAQSAFINYFRYNSSTIKVLRKDTYSDSDWITLLKNELNYKRPILYRGVDLNFFEDDLHAWVCDGYIDDLFHMNWGWGGNDENFNGWYQIGALNPKNTDYKFNEKNKALIGIQPSLIEIRTEDVKCHGENSGSVLISIYRNNGQAPYRYILTGPINEHGSFNDNITIGNLKAGNYVISIVDNMGVSESKQFQITEPFLPLTVNIIKHDITHCGGSDGSAIASVSGGTSPNTYSWSNGGIGSSINGLPAGDYSITITDANGCTGSKGITIDPPISLIVSIIKQDVTHFGGSDGTAEASASGGMSPYTYAWSPSGGNSSTATGLSAGTYTVTVTDQNSCSNNATVPIGEPPFSVTVNNGGNGSTSIPISIPNTCDIIYYTLGGPLFQSGPVNGPIIFNRLPAGDYVITFLCRDGHNYSQSFTVKQYLFLDITHTALSLGACINNPALEAHLSGRGGFPPYYYGGGDRIIKGLGFHKRTFWVTDDVGNVAEVEKFYKLTGSFCAVDPNDILGATGYGQEKFISVNDKLPYTVHFENSPAFATAPAQKVTLTIPIDKNANIYSLELGDFGFANKRFTVPAGKNFYTTRLDVTDSLGIYVDVTAGIDINKNQVFWIFQGIDASTGLAPVNPLTGLLPINDSITHKGEGFVTYSIKPKKADKTRDSIQAQASIVFDNNEAIKTNTWGNTVDALPPVSKIKSVTPVDAQNVRVAWQAHDDAGGSGIANYKLLVSTNDNPYTPYAQGITDTFLVLHVARGNKYKLQAIATDNVNNTELLKSQADTLLIIANDSAEASIEGFITYDNTANSPLGKTAVYLRNKNGATADSTLTDSTGFFSIKQVKKGDFILSAHTNLDWGGVNATDALIVKKYAIGAAQLSSLRTLSADVNLSHTVNATDALTISKRTAGLISSFPAGDWVFEKDSIKVEDKSIHRNVKGICTGDVNGSYLPPTRSKNQTVSLTEDGKISIASLQDFEIPIRTAGNLSLGAITLGLSYPPDLITVKSVSSKAKGLVYRIDNGVIKIAWADLVPIAFSKNEAIVILKCTANNNAAPAFNIGLLPGGEFAGPDANVIPGVILYSPALERSVVTQNASEPEASAHFSLSQNYPNPFSKITEIEYELPEAGEVILKIYNVLGIPISEIVHTPQPAGKYTIKYDGSGLASGVYIYEIKITGTHNNFTQARIMSVLK